MLSAIAWRNLWRNKRRTLITLAAVAAGAATMVALYGMMSAYEVRILEGLTGSFMGHAQIHREGYRDKRASYLTVANAEEVLAAVRATEGVKGASGRVFGGAHAAFVRGSDEEVRSGGGEDVASPVVSLLGIDPVHEKAVTDMSTRVEDGRWLRDETDVVVGSGVAKRNNLQVGDAFLPTAVDATGALRGPWAVSDQVPRVVGIARTGVEEIDTTMVLIPRTYLAKLMRMEDEVHEVAISAESAEDLDALVTALRRSVAEVRAGDGSAEALQATAPLSVTASGAEAEGGLAPDAGAAEAGPTEDGGAASREPERLRLVGVEVTEGETEEGSQPSGQLLRGRFLERSEDIVLSEPAAAALAVAPGDRISLSVPVDCGEDIPAEECPPSEEGFVVAGVVSADADLLGGRFGLVSESVVSGNIAALAPRSVAALGEGETGQVTALVQGIRGEVAAGDEVLAWYGIAPEIKEMLAVMEVAPMIFLVIIFFAAGLGIVNSLLMATFERTKELGLMLAMGMRPRKVVLMVMAESAQLAVVGAAVGLVLGAGVVLYWAAYGLNLGVFSESGSGFSFQGITFDPMLWPRFRPGDLVKVAIPVMIMTTLAGVWPAIRAARLHPTDALRHD